MPRFSRKRSVRTARHKKRNARRNEAEDKYEVERLKRLAQSEDSQKQLAKEPHAMVVHRDKIGKYLTRLEMELRKLMEPNSAMKLKVLKRNNLKDFIVNGAALGVSHLLVITRTEQSVMLRIIRCPQGPTLTFRIHSYTLGRHIVSSQKHPLHFQQQYEHSPLIIMNGFNDVNKKHLKLVQSMFQSMFPPIAVDTVKLSVIRRCCLISYDKDRECFELRHYAIKTVPTGISKSAKKLLQSKIPDLSKYRDISEFILNPGQLSESEFEGEQKEVELAQDLSTRGCRKGQKTNIRLIELGPRITFSLVKIVDGVNDGEVLYHAYIVKTPKEIQELRERAPLAKKARGKRLLAEEHRIIRKLTNIAAKKKEEMEAEQREKDRLIEKQRAVTGEESNEDRSGNVRSLKRKNKGDDNNEEAKDEESSFSKRQKLLAERKNRISDGLTRAERRKKRAEEAAATRNKAKKKRKVN